ncbi:MAG TPA: presenilin family intramembrane aspartyl protease [Candidatus Bathyarchaeia archaeon]|jgi:presenilin-like A22 family membrane protease|nr:presenilin family intramembrane aspartyl protease [Candidatus Bathyarchaeia archaeon]
MSEPQQPNQPLPQGKEQDRFKFEIIYLIPILASIIFGLGCAYLLSPQQPATIPVTPLPQNTASGSFGNALYFVILVAVAATVFYLLLKRRSKRIIKGLIVVAMTTASLLLSLVYLSAILSYIPSLNVLWIPLSIVITVMFDLAVFRLGSIARNVAVVGIGGALGIFFGFEIQLWTAVLILSFLAVYDVFAVYRGPVGKIAQSAGGLEDLQGLSYDFRDIQMGLGDLVFYSMLTGAMFFSFPSSVFPCIVSVVGIMAGSIVTFFMLERKGIFPGLPFPILLGLAGGLITGLVILPLL